MALTEDEKRKADLLYTLKNALEWMGRKPKGTYERHSFILAEGAVRNAIVRAETERKP